MNMKTAIFFCLALAAAPQIEAHRRTCIAAATTGKISLWGNEGVDRDTHIFEEAV